VSHLSGYLLALGAGLAGTAYLARRFGTLAVVAALYATQARAHGPVPALHLTGIVLALIAAAGTVAALALPAVPSTALYP
jgi:hypothetical protein